MKYCMTVFEYSKYFSELKEDAKKRYKEKMKIADCTKDPYCYLESKNTVSGSVEWSEWPHAMFAITIEIKEKLPSEFYIVMFYNLCKYYFIVCTK